MVFKDDLILKVHKQNIDIKKNEQFLKTIRFLLT